MLSNLIASIANPGSVDIKQVIMSLMLSIPIIFLSLSLHETAHGFVAYKLGDPTAKNMGRLTLNPLKHIDIFGFLCMLLCGFGWAKPVPINTRYFKKPKRDMAITGAAGPVANLLLACVFAILWGFTYKFALANIYNLTATSVQVINALIMFFTIGLRINVVFAVFNLIPIPPLDGSRLFLVFAPSKVYWKIMQYEQYIQLGFMLLLVFGVLDGPINTVSNFVIRIITTIFI